MMKKINLCVAGKSFRFSVLGLTVYLILLGLLCSLGAWQLRRAEEKKQYLQEQKQAQQEKRMVLNQHDSIDLKSLEYKKVSVTGQYDVSHQFLIDNQIKKGRPGYFVMTPLIMDGHNRSVLINRGWIPMNKDRSIKPDIAIDKVTTTLTGRINHFPVVGIKLAGADIPTDSWPAVVQVVNTEILAKRLGYPLFNFQIELDVNMTDGYDRTWKDRVIMPPEKHLAYAVQWFALAITLTILFVWYSFKNNE